MESTNSLTATTVLETKIVRSKRYAPPAHYILKIHSFSQLCEIVEKPGDGKYESDEFEVGDYKWKLVLYPNGNLKGNGKGHISLYLASTDKRAISEITGGDRINVLVNFFIYDHIQDKYMMIEDGKIKRFYVLRTEHGFDQLLPLADFNDQSNGYLVDDCCVFGAEVHVMKNTVKLKADEFSLMKDPGNGTFTWKIDEFSTLEKEVYYSEVFSVGGCKWQLKMCPKGHLEEKDRSLSLYLHLDANPRQSKVYVEFKLLIKDQLNGMDHDQHNVSHWFEDSSYSCGFGRFMLLNDLRNVSKGFLVNDTVVIEAQITLISVSQDLNSYRYAGRDIFF